MIGFKVAILHAVAGTLIPLFVVALMTRFFGKNRSFREGIAVWRFALFAAFAMTIPYLTVAYLLGPVLGFGLFAIWLLQGGTRSLQSALFLLKWKSRHWQQIVV